MGTPNRKSGSGLPVSNGSYTHSTGHHTPAVMIETTASTEVDLTRQYQVLRITRARLMPHPKCKDWGHPLQVFRDMVNTFHRLVGPLKNEVHRALEKGLYQDGASPGVCDTGYEGKRQHQRPLPPVRHQSDDRLHNEDRSVRGALGTDRGASSCSVTDLRHDADCVALCVGGGDAFSARVGLLDHRTGWDGEPSAP